MSRGPYPILLMLAMSLPGAARALGLGEIRVDSALNEPLSAQIDIVGATRDELAALTAKVANREVFQHYGADRPAFLSTATFKVGMDSRGRPVLNVRSADPFTDPVINLLVDLRWGNGELVREYSLLLDPPGFSASSRLASYAPAASERPAASSEGAPRASQPAEGYLAATTQEPPARANPAEANIEIVPSDGPADHDRAVVARHTVVPRDTLRGIVRRAGAPNESYAKRMMIAIFRANPHAFDGNINRLRLGAVLDIPSDEGVKAIDASEAKREVRAHMAAWRLDGRPAAARIAPNTAAAPQARVMSTPSAVPAPASNTDALKGRVQSLEQALDDLHKQLARENAALESLKQQAEHTSSQPAQAAEHTPSQPAQAVNHAESQPADEAAPAAAEPGPAAAAAAPAHPAETAAPVPRAKRPVSVEVIRADTRHEQVLAAVAPHTARQMSGMGLIAIIALALTVLLGGFAYLRRRALKALEQPQSPHSMHEPGSEAPVLPPASAPQSARERAVAPAARPMEQPKPAAPAAFAAPAAPAPAASDAHDMPSHSLTDKTTQELEIDAELLERSYLDAMAIDTLGIDTLGADTADTGKNPTAAHALPDQSAAHHAGSEDPASQTATGLETVALEALDLDTGIQKSDLNTAILDVKAFNPNPAGKSDVDYNLTDLDATAEHNPAQHVNMPSALRDRVSITERRMSIVDVLKTAIERDPQRRDLRMKLLETYYSAASMNRRAFLDVVRELSHQRELLTPEDWEQVIKMGEEIAPTDAVFIELSKDDAAAA